MLAGKKILIGITGSIAAYKIPLLVRLLVKAGAEVKVIMTDAAQGFVSPLTLSTLSKHPVTTDSATNHSWANHVMLGRWADVFVIAPLSCNTLSKMAHGSCDNLLTAVYLSSTCPVLAAPAMDEDMWIHPATKSNIATIRSFGNHVMPVSKGELASGLHGEGRMAEPEAIMQWLNDFFIESASLKGVTALVTAGPTYEALDPVRFIGNHSSGKMGVAIAAELAKRGANVILVLGPSALAGPEAVNTIRVTSASEMLDACTAHFPACDWAIMSAAVADYTPVAVQDQKIKKAGDEFSLTLKKTTDILKRLGEVKQAHQKLVGFALETNNEEAYAIGKLQDKNADLIVLNSLNDAGAGFGHDSNKITIFDRNGTTTRFETKSKKEVAADIIDTITRYKK